MSGHLLRETRLFRNEIIFAFFVTSYAVNVMVLLVISSLHFETPMTFDGRKMMLFVNLKNFGIDPSLHYWSILYTKDAVLCSSHLL